MIRIAENTAYTKSIILEAKGFSFLLGVGTISWIRTALKRRYEIFDYRKRISGYRIRSKGLYIQRIMKKLRIFCIEISWTRTKEYQKRKVYTYFHKKRYLKRKPGLLERLKAELKQCGL
jgi:hypothetical protein